MESNFDEKDSLKLINEMINQAKNNIQSGAAKSIIFWGYIVAATALVNFALLYILDKPYLSYNIWWIMFPAAIISVIVNRKREKKAIVTTHIDKIISNVWMAFMISVITLLISVFGLVYILDNWNITLIINPIILAFIGLAQFATATACRFKPFYIGAVIFWGGALLCVTSYGLLQSGSIQFIILALCMVFGFCVPGHLLNKKAKK